MIGFQKYLHYSKPHKWRRAIENSSGIFNIFTNSKIKHPLYHDIYGRSFWYEREKGHNGSFSITIKTK